MIIIYGSRLYGRIKECGPSYVATSFAHVWYLPLFPVGSKLILGSGQDGLVGMPAPLHFKSVLAGYLRVWGPIAVLATVITGLQIVLDENIEPLSKIVVGAFIGVVTLVLFAATVLAYTILGKLSETEKRRRRIYARHTGVFADPADMTESHDHLRNTLLGTIAERSRGLASMGYRAQVDPVQAWPHLALDPTHADETIVTAAFTLARLEAAKAKGPTVHEKEHLQDQIWHRIERGFPHLLQPQAPGM